MIRGVSRVLPRSGKLFFFKFHQVIKFSENIIILVRQYSVSAPIQGGVVTQVIGAVVDVQVRSINCRMKLPPLCFSIIFSSMDLYHLFLMP